MSVCHFYTINLYLNEVMKGVLHNDFHLYMYIKIS